MAVPDDWIGFGLDYIDLFRSDHCGYWMRNLEKDKTRRERLVWVFEEDERDWGPYFVDTIPEEIENELHKEAVEAWRSGKPLPKNYYRMNEETMVKAYKAGVEKWGVDWYENADANSYDYVIQMALLGDVVYG